MNNDEPLEIVPFDTEDTPQGITMSTLEIAAVAGMSHDRVLLIVGRTLESLGYDSRKYARSGIDRMGGHYFELPRSELDAILAVVLLSVALVRAIRKRRSELELGQTALRCIYAGIVAGVPVKEAVGVTMGNLAGVTKVSFDLAPPTTPPPTFTLVIRDGERGVDLRDLESKQEFANWAKSRLADFVEGYDFEVSDNLVKNSEGRPRKDYAVSIKCAKHIAMMEQTERGTQVRERRR